MYLLIDFAIFEWILLQTFQTANSDNCQPCLPNKRTWLAGSPATLLSPHFLPGCVWAEPGGTGREKECLSYPGMTGYVRFEKERNKRATHVVDGVKR